MPNNYFKFKQFTICQGNAAMKVGTDGVLLGAWADVAAADRILDIGTGTGLVALMLAQRSNAIIDAVEIDASAVMQARENIKNSPWADRISIVHKSFQEFQIHNKNNYDLIVCNPPYFTSSVKAHNALRSLARHDDRLSRYELIEGVLNLLSKNGKFSLIVPFIGSDVLIELASEYQLYPQKILKIRPVPGKKIVRIIFEFGKSLCQPREAEMIIETGERHQYSIEYIELTRDFYLKF
jgi:tRNA1Val (adenine37-N6)-methyltransferase